MITAPQGAERHQLESWSTHRLLSYLNARRKRCIKLVARLDRCWSDEYTRTSEDVEMLRNEIDYIKSILAKREHVK